MNNRTRNPKCYKNNTHIKSISFYRNFVVVPAKKCSPLRTPGFKSWADIKIHGFVVSCSNHVTDRSCVNVQFKSYIKSLLPRLSSGIEDESTAQTSPQTSSPSFDLFIFVAFIGPLQSEVFMDVGSLCFFWASISPFFLN